MKSFIFFGLVAAVCFATAFKLWFAGMMELSSFAALIMLVFAAAAFTSYWQANSRWITDAFERRQAAMKETAIYMIAETLNGAEMGNLRKILVRAVDGDVQIEVVFHPLREMLEAERQAQAEREAQKNKGSPPARDPDEISDEDMARIKEIQTAYEKRLAGQIKN